MSTLRLLKDDAKYGKKGQTVTVPFLQARDLVAAGVAERPGQSAGNGKPEGEPTVAAKKLDEAKAVIAAAEKRIKELEAENAELSAENDKLEAEKRKLTADAEAAKKAAK